MSSASTNTRTIYTCTLILRQGEPEAALDLTDASQNARQTCHLECQLNQEGFPTFTIRGRFHESRVFSLFDDGFDKLYDNSRWEFNHLLVQVSGY